MLLPSDRVLTLSEHTLSATPLLLSEHVFDAVPSSECALSLQSDELKSIDHIIVIRMRMSLSERMLLCDHISVKDAIRTCGIVFVIEHAIIIMWIMTATDSRCFFCITELSSPFLRFKPRT